MRIPVAGVLLCLVTVEAASTMSRLFPGGRFVLTLERAVGRGSFGKDKELWDSGVFDAMVYPDLPPARTVRGWVALSLKRSLAAVAAAGPGLASPGGAGDPGHAQGGHAQTPSASTTQKNSGSGGGGGGRPGYTVRSVPVQISTKRDLRRRLTEAAAPGPHRADALLLLSGSHPVRRLPLAQRVLPGVLDELRLAAEMKRSGELPVDIPLWVVANPLTESNAAGVGRLQRKIDLGAQVVLTQPPLAWGPFSRWLAAAHDAGLTARAKVIVGLPTLDTPAQLRFWLGLCGVARGDQAWSEAFAHLGGAGGRPGLGGGKSPMSSDSWARKRRPDAGARDQEPEEAGKGGTQALCCEGGGGGASPVPAYGQEWLARTMARLRGLQGRGVAGVHVMAVGPKARAAAMELVESGVLAGGG